VVWEGRSRETAPYPDYLKALPRSLLTANTLQQHLHQQDQQQKESTHPSNDQQQEPAFHETLNAGHCRSACCATISLQDKHPAPVLAYGYHRPCFFPEAAVAEARRGPACEKQGGGPPLVQYTPVILPLCGVLILGSIAWLVWLRRKA
jgi:hypothetical protein